MALAPTAPVPAGDPNAGRVSVSGNLLSTGQPPNATTPPTTPPPITPTDPNAGRTDTQGNLLSTGQLPTSPSQTPSTPTTPTPSSAPTTPSSPLSSSPIQTQLDAAKQQALKIQSEIPTDTSSSSTSAVSTPTSTTVDGTDVEAADRAALAQAQADYQAQAKQVSDTITNIQNGTIPLNAGEQAQVDALSNQFNTLITQQGQTNSGATGQAQIRGYQTGAAEYDPTFQVKTIGAIVSAGVQKIADLDTQKAGAIATLTNALKAADIKSVQDAYSVYQDASDKRTAAIQKTIDDTASAIKTANDAATAAAKTQYDEVTKPIQDMAAEAAKNGAPANVVASITNSKDVASAMTAGQGYYQDPTSTAGEYAAYVSQATASGQTPVSAASFLATQKFNDAYATAKGTAVGKAAGEGTGTSGTLTQSSITSKADIPAAIRPYVSKSANGTWYMDLSGVSSTARAGLIAKAGDIPVITNANEALDLVNIRDVNGKLQTIASVMKDLTDPSALQRDLGGAGLSTLSAIAQTDPKKAAALALNDSALDILKAISGVQGFRGNQTAIENVKNSLPSITDTEDTAATKLSFIAQQMQDRETALLGSPGNTDNTNFVIRSESQAQTALTDAGQGNPDVQKQITQILNTNDPTTGQPYSYLDAAQILGISIPALSQNSGPTIGGNALPGISAPTHSFF